MSCEEYISRVNNLINHGLDFKEAVELLADEERHARATVNRNEMENKKEETK